MVRCRIPRRTVLLACALLAACGSDRLSISLVNAPWIVEQGSSVVAKIDVVAPRGSTPELRFRALPDGVTAVQSEGQGGTRREISLVASWDAGPGRYRVDLVATAGDQSATASSEILITEAPPLEVKLVSPPDRAWVNDAVEVKLDVTGPAREAEVRIDNELFHTFEAPFTTSVDVSALAEGTYHLSAFVRRGERTFEAHRTSLLTIDRTAPEVLDRVPLAGETSHNPDDSTFRVSFSEPVLTHGVPVVTSTPPGLQLTQVQLDPSGTVLTGTLVNASNGMAAEAELTGVVDRAGNAVRDPRWSWSYLPWREVDTQELNATGRDAWDAQLLMRMERPLVSYTSAQGSTSEVQLREYDGAHWFPFATWSPAHAIHTALTTSQAPVAAFAAPSGTPLRAHRLDGTAWIELVGLSTAIPVALTENVRVGINHLGEPIVACNEGATGTTLYVASWASGGWQPVLERSQPLVIRVPLLVAAPPSGARTFLAWFENAAVHWASWDGSAWQDAFAPATGVLAPWIGQASAWLDPSGNPVVAGTARVQLQTGYRYDAKILLWDGQQWADVGGSLPTNGSGRDVKGIELGWSPAGVLHAAVASVSQGGWRLDVFRWNDTAWQAIHAAPAGTSLATETMRVRGIAFTPSRVYVLWTRYWVQDTTTRLHLAYAPL